MLKTPDDFVPLSVAQLGDGAASEPFPSEVLPWVEPLLFVFRGSAVLVHTDTLALPSAAQAGLPRAAPARWHTLGHWRGRSTRTAWVDADFEAPAGQSFVNLRALFGAHPDEVLGLAGRAAQIAEWSRTHQFCGACATPMQLEAGERAYKCPACAMTAYPRISPAMMVLIRRGNEVLLARHTNSPTARFTALAGFLEAGESIEEAIHREVMEEVGLKVHNLRYFNSQSWPFPHSLMIAFTADYESGDITIDPSEIAEARWFSTQEPIPHTYPTVSISGLLINAAWAV